MWGFKKSAELKAAKMDEDLLKKQIQKKLENYTNSQGPSRFYGVASAHGMVIDFEQAVNDSLRYEYFYGSQKMATA